jgi:membrane-bound metal-dependent hydrolase YbcI (DUF457 family)
VDNLTHSLFGATLARTRLGRSGRGTAATLVLASNAPDIDIVAATGGSLKYLEWHRGMTHGPVGLLALAVVSAAIVSGGLTLWDRHRQDTILRSDSADDRRAGFPMLVAVACVGIAFHVLMDLPTSYGIRFFSPFTWRWYAVDWMPIVDVYLWIVLGSGLYIGRVSPEARRRNATIVLTFVAALYGVRGFMHREAIDLAPRLFGPTLPAPCDAPVDIEPLLDSWPKAPPSPPAEPGRRCLVEIAALPTFLSPFDWRIIARTSNSYEIHDVNVLDSRFRDNDGESSAFWRQTLRYPNIWTPEVMRAASTRGGRVFLGFSRFPAARTARDSSGAAVVRFTDVRFVGGPAVTEQPIRRVQPFTLTVRFDATGNIVSETLGQ